MSDGPHHSLPLSRSWKKTAEYAANAAFSVSDVATEMLKALQREFPRPLLEAVRGVFASGDQHQLFLGDAADRLDAIRRADPGSPGTIALVECGTEASIWHNSAGDAFECVVEQAAREILAAHIRCIEEHYLREAGFNGATLIRDRLEQAATSCDLHGLLGVLQEVHLKSDAFAGARGGLEDGPDLPR